MGGRRARADAYGKIAGPIAGKGGVAASAHTHLSLQQVKYDVYYYYYYFPA